MYLRKYSELKVRSSLLIIFPINSWELHVVNIIHIIASTCESVSPLHSGVLCFDYSTLHYICTVHVDILMCSLSYSIFSPFTCIMHSYSRKHKIMHAHIHTFTHIHVHMHTHTDLIPFTIYTVEVAASTVVGIGPFSSPPLPNMTNEGCKLHIVLQ